MLIGELATRAGTSARLTDVRERLRGQLAEALRHRETSCLKIR
jgi:hypothetical protein